MIPMTTKTTTTPARGLVPLPERTARLITAAGALATAATTGLSWTWSSDFPGDLTYYGSPAGLQIVTLVGGLLTLLLATAALGVRGLQWLTPAGRNAPPSSPPSPPSPPPGSPSSPSPSSSAG